MSHWEWDVLTNPPDLHAGTGPVTQEWVMFYIEIKLYVSFAQELYKKDDILQKRRII